MNDKGGVRRTRRGGDAGRWAVVLLGVLTLAAGGRPERSGAFLGLVIEPLAPPPGDATKAPPRPAAADGVQVKYVFEGLAAERAGIRAGDRLLTIEGAPIREVDDVLAAVGSKRVGGVVTVQLVRRGQRLSVDATLSARPDFHELTKRRWIGQRLPDDFVFVDTATGESVALATVLAGRPAIVEYWATWCGPCRSIEPSLEYLRLKHRDRGVEVVHVTSEDLPAVTAHFAKGATDKHRVFSDPKHLMAVQLMLQSVPVLLYLDADGVIRDISWGAAPKAVIEGHLRRALRRTSAPL